MQTAPSANITTINTTRHLIALSIIGLLTACTSNTPAPISSINDTRQTASAPVRQLTEKPQVQALPVQQPLQQPVQSATTQPATTQPPQTATAQPSQTSGQSANHSTVQPAPVQVTQSAADSSQSNNVQMRDGHIVYNRQYDEIPKGSYTGGPAYTVKHGDTLFYIAWITGNDYRDLAKRNNITEPYSLKPGQVLQVENASGAPLTGENAISRADAAQPANQTQKTTTAVASASTITYAGTQGKQNEKKMLPGNKKPVHSTTATGNTDAANSNINTSRQNANQQSVANSTTGSPAKLTWRWPTNGKIIASFSANSGDNKGIDIAGKQGQPILAAASGRVVYAGNALRGYGNLIIIKHNDDYLSAYAHNDTMRVNEQQDVKAGQQIATMGNTGTNSTRLHFEVRYKGKPVNPLRYLPQR